MTHSNTQVLGPSGLHVMQCYANRQNHKNPRVPAVNVKTDTPKGLPMTKPAKMPSLKAMSLAMGIPIANH